MEITKKEVAQLIQQKRPDTFLSHFAQFLSNTMWMCGTASESEVRLWKKNMWTLSLYAVFVFTFNKDQHLIDIRTKPNVFGMAVCSGIFLAIVSFCAYQLVPLYHNDRFWIYTGIAIVFLAIYVAICITIYKSEKSIQKEAIFNMLDMEVADETTPKKNYIVGFLIRLFAYPISLGTLYVSVVHFFPTHRYVLGIAGIAIASTYLIVDVLLLFKNKN